MINIQLAAKVAHNVNRIYCQSIGDDSQVPWDEAPEWLKTSVEDGVRFLMENPSAGPQDCHLNWMRHKLDDGWVHGEEKDETVKTHPCLVPYVELPQEQQMKDHFFHAVIRAMDH